MIFFLSILESIYNVLRNDNHRRLCENWPSYQLITPRQGPRGSPQLGWKWREPQAPWSQGLTAVSRSLLALGLNHWLGPCTHRLVVAVKADWLVVCEQFLGSFPQEQDSERNSSLRIATIGYLLLRTFKSGLFIKLMSY